jgi:hypothetical protein
MVHLVNLERQYFFRVEGRGTILEYLLHLCLWCCLLNKPSKLVFHLKCKLCRSHQLAVSAFFKDLAVW